MAEIRAGMWAKRSPLLIASPSTGVGLQIPLILRVEMLPAEAVVLRHWLVVLELALRALPAEDKLRLLIQLLVDVVYPCLYAFQMHRDAAALAGPNPILLPDLL
jgi:hypothetical protein